MLDTFLGVGLRFHYSSCFGLKVQASYSSCIKKRISAQFNKILTVWFSSLRLACLVLVRWMVAMSCWPKCKIHIFHPFIHWVSIWLRQHLVVAAQNVFSMLSRKNTSFWVILLLATVTFGLCISCKTGWVKYLEVHFCFLFHSSSWWYFWQPTIAGVRVQDKKSFIRRPTQCFSVNLQVGAHFIGRILNIYLGIWCPLDSDIFHHHTAVGWVLAA